MTTSQLPLGTWQIISTRASEKEQCEWRAALSGRRSAASLPIQNSTLSKRNGMLSALETKRMKTMFWSSAILVAAAIGFSGCGKKSEPAGPAKSAAIYPLPEPPLVADCAPGIPGGRFVVVSYGDPKTFNPITANEQSSEEIYRHLYAALLGFDWTSQQVSPGLAESWTNAPD